MWLSERAAIAPEISPSAKHLQFSEQRATGKELNQSGEMSRAKANRKR
jgi:hypothetical protein